MHSTECAIIALAVRILCSRMVAELEADFIERLAMLQRSRMSSLHVAAIAQARLAKLCCAELSCARTCDFTSRVEYRRVS